MQFILIFDSIHNFCIYSSGTLKKIQFYNKLLNNEFIFCFQGVVTFFVVCAYASAGWAGLGWAGHGSARGALEGALGGQWIPDVPVAHGAAAGVYAPGWAGWGAGWPGWAGWGAGWAGHGVSAKGALEGALGGQWIPDTHHRK